MNKTKTFGLVSLLTSLLLASCGQQTLPDATYRPQYIQTVSIDASDTPEGIAQRYGHPVVAFDLLAGQALLGLTADEAAQVQASGLRSQAAAQIEPNVNRFVGGGTLARAVGARTVWAGGAWQVWAGGARTVWAGGQFQPLPQNSGALNQINLQAAQALAPNLGRGVTVAVIDTGLDLGHPAFAGALAPASAWKDFYGNDAVPQDEGTLGVGGYGHGTAVASIILQVAPAATILPIRVLGSDGSGDVAMVAQAISYAASKGAKVINLSLGSDTSSKAVQDAINKVTALGVLVVSSAGNDALNTLAYPAAQADEGAAGDRSLSVGSVDATDRKSSFSNYGKDLELMAPGENVYTAAPGNLTSAWSGTSMAAPLAAGGLALALGQKPSADPKALETVVLSSVRSITAQNPGTPADQLGDGRLDLAAFLRAALGGR